VEERGPYLSILTPFSYVVKENGELTSIDDEPLIKEA
jgi:spore germination protein YaaH